MKKEIRITPARWIITGVFLAAIIIGALLLMLPCATVAEGGLAPLTAFFTATSATCVTGLSLIDIGCELTLFGQIVVLLLIQLGGLGIMTIGTFLLVMVGQRLSLQNESVLMSTYGTSAADRLSSLLRLTVGFTLFIEAIGTILLWRCYLTPPPEVAAQMGPHAGNPLYYALFHSVSAFCNAGFSLHSNSLIDFQHNPLYLTTIALLIIAGGLGFLVLYNIATIRFWDKNLKTRRRLTLHSRVVLITTAVLLIVGTALILTQEWNNTLSAIPRLTDKLSCAFFHSVTPRTAGFNCLPMTEILGSTRFTTLILMFIGGSPGSTAGGIKTSTLFVMLMTISAICKGRNRTVIFQRAIPERVVREALAIFLLSIIGILLAYGLLLYSEHPRTPGEASNLYFETISAFATVGLSINCTTTLSNTGQFIIMVCMFVGRLGPMTLALLIGSRNVVERIRYPEETIVVG
ncbi:MAG: TrkH family potassium uptake protein [Kiritimatiellae bacterium]|nr:TrkH family potassium uptake protein [Kiritimatiellia bacterium]